MSHLTDTDLSRIAASPDPEHGDEMLHLAGKQLAAPRVPGFNLPAYDYIGLAYYGSTNNVQTVTYKTGGSGGTTVAELTLTYAGGGVSDDDQLTGVAKS